MGNPAHLSGALPAGDANGLAAIAQLLVEQPRRMHVVVALVDTKTIRRDVDDDTTTATVRVRRIEVITNKDDQATMRRLLMRAFERRTGQRPCSRSTWKPPYARRSARTTERTHREPDT